MCAFFVRLSINGRAKGGRVAGKRFRESRSPTFKFRSSLKASAIASNAVIVGVRDAPCTTGRGSCKSLSNAGRMSPVKDFVLKCKSTE
jgi:hypothetical protein